MNSTTVGVIIKQQAWFRSHVDAQTLEPFPVDAIDSVALHPTSAFRARVLVGRGPVERELTSEFLLWFEQGELDYPVFQSPSVSPSNAALMLTRKPRRLVASEMEALALIEVSVVMPVHPDFRAEYETSPPEQEGRRSVVAIRGWLSEARVLLEQAVGLYALYQYPIVWEPIGVHPFVGFVDIESQRVRVSTRIEADNFIPFRLNVSAKVKEGQLVDDGLVDLPRLKGREFHLPLLLLQRALWQRNIQLRFLETFLLLEYLTGWSPVQDAGRAERELLYAAIEECVLSTHPAHDGRIKALKHLILQAPFRERLHAYLGHLGVSVDETTLRKMVKVRHDLAHARSVDDSVLIPLELEIRLIARKALRRELANRGVTFGQHE